MGAGDVRRKEREITDGAAILKILERSQVLRLAISTPTVPYILPVNFGMEPDGRVLYIHGAQSGTKYTHLAREGKVSFELDAAYGTLTKNGSVTTLYESVIGWGAAREVTDSSGKRHALERIMHQCHADTTPIDPRMAEHTRIWRIDVAEMTGKTSR